ncbi:uncharacterized protein A4U43_C05F32360 [Asparagus officinalis]|uniref:SKP1 component POZ domain-containing protein n=1 Tax=Asparagus officinalis TaxID=4686 RepID=A0A5P1EW43_ASPOF|nr:uncharacterized protein A4U43_C05F32360 [Asparagus officinalis]
MTAANDSKKTVVLQSSNGEEFEIEGAVAMESQTILNGVIEEIINLHRSLLPRPSIVEVEAAMKVVKSIEKKELAKMESISKQRKCIEIPEELFFVLQEMQKNLVYFQSKE